MLKRLSFEQYFRWWFHIIQKPESIDSKEFLNSWSSHRHRIQRFLKKQRKANCRDCGRFVVGQMTLDHLPEFTKSFDFSDAGFYPLNLIEKEVKKCEVVCRSCHDLREFAREELRKPLEKDLLSADDLQIIKAFTKISQITGILSGQIREKEKKTKDRRKHRYRARAFRSIFDEDPDGEVLN